MIQALNNEARSKFLIFGVLLISLVGLAGLFQGTKLNFEFLLIEQAEFEEFMVKFGKSYTELEYLQRLNIFNQNLAFIRSFNAEGKDLYLKKTFFTDLTAEEFKNRYLNSIENNIETKYQEETHVFDEKLEDLYPNSVNWLSLGAVTSVKNQGNCASGWAFATAGALESAWKISNHTLEDLSEQQLIDCSGNYGCQAGWPSVAMQYIIQNGGLTSESNYPYIGFQEVQCNLDAALIISARMRSYSPVTSNSYTSMAAALSSAPVVSMVDASGPIWQNYGGGVLDDPTCGTNLNHAILLIGYNLSASPSYWLGKNSWGASWGESGYVRVSIKPGAGVCGIQMSVVYPLI